MRTTINIEDDVLEQARKVAARLGIPFRKVINEALRAGLKKVEQPAKRRPYKTTPHEMGLRRGYNLDNIHEVLSTIESEDYR